MTPDERRLRDAFLAEMWPTVREVPKADRAVNRVRQECGKPVRKRGVRKAS